MKLTATERELCNKIEFDQQVLVLAKKLCPQGQLRQLGVMADGLSTYKPGKGLSVRTKKEEYAEEWVETLSEVLPDGYLALTSEDSDADQAEVAIIKSDDPFDLVRLKGTKGEATDVATATILEKLQDWDARYGLTVLGAAYDWVEFALEALPSDAMGLIDEMIALCPDLLSEGFDDLPEIMAEYRGKELPEEFETFANIDWSLPGAGKLAFQRSLEDGGSVYLWWD